MAGEYWSVRCAQSAKAKQVRCLVLCCVIKEREKFANLFLIYIWLAGNTISFLWLAAVFCASLLNTVKTKQSQFALLKSNRHRNSSFRWRSSLRLSLKDILSAVDTGAEFAWRKKLWFEIGKTEVEETLKNCSSNCLLPFFKSCGKEGFETQILEVLDQGTCNCICTPSGAYVFFWVRRAKKATKKKKGVLKTKFNVG